MTYMVYKIPVSSNNIGYSYTFVSINIFIRDKRSGLRNLLTGRVNQKRHKISRLTNYEYG